MAHLQDFLAASAVRKIDRDSPIKPARAQKRGVEDVGAVGGGDDLQAAGGRG